MQQNKTALSTAHRQRINCISPEFSYRIKKSRQKRRTIFFLVKLINKQRYAGMEQIWEICGDTTIISFFFFFFFSLYTTVLSLFILAFFSPSLVLCMLVRDLSIYHRRCLTKRSSFSYITANGHNNIRSSDSEKERRKNKQHIYPLNINNIRWPLFVF